MYYHISTSTFNLTKKNLVYSSKAQRAHNSSRLLLLPRATTVPIRSLTNLSTATNLRLDWSSALFLCENGSKHISNVCICLSKVSRLGSLNVSDEPVFGLESKPFLPLSVRLTKTRNRWQHGRTTTQNTHNWKSGFSQLYVLYGHFDLKDDVYVPPYHQTKSHE